MRRPWNDGQRPAGPANHRSGDGTVLRGAARLAERFFAGLVSLDQATALSAARAKDLLPATPAGPLDDGDDDATPWHDQTMAMAERMKLAEGRPLRRRLMAAMAQQDCGQCGYNCEDYSNVLFLKKEERFNLCVPGGKETARMLKKLWDETDPAAPDARPALVPDTVAAPPAEAGRSRDNPVAAKVSARYRLSKETSEKFTQHVEFDISGTGLSYLVGDSFEIFRRTIPHSSTLS